ncbi:MAG: molecular chaperone TorD family protein [Bacillus sp. (in: Bacteria)]|nr:molecular chaperone TorD family protein [Bacillus sp. (in: firmicutes)]
MVLAVKGLTLQVTQSLLQNKLYVNNIIRFLLDSPPERENMSTLAENHDFQLLSESSEGAKMILEFIESYKNSGNLALVQAKEEFNTLFVGPNVLPAPPWESVYLGKENLLFEEQTLKVRDCYREYGLKFIRENNEPEDHIVIELEFLAYLTQQTLECEERTAISNLWKDQMAFLDNHFLQWTPKFCELLLKSAQSKWFIGAALLLKEYIALEHEITAIIKEAMENE